MTHRTSILGLLVAWLVLFSCWSGRSATSFGQATGAPVAKASQLVGTWARSNTSSDMDGLEFRSDGKVMVYMGGGNDAMAADYSIGGDGRLSIALGPLNQFYIPSMSGDQLWLKDPDAGAVSQYRRLKSGETIGAAIAAQKQADQKSIQDRNAALPAFLLRKDLVMLVLGGPATAPPPSAVQFITDGTNYQGNACFDGKPPHLDALGLQIQGSPDNPIVAVTFGQQIAPQPGPPIQNGLVVNFHLAGSAQNLSLTAPVDFSGEAFATASCTMVIRPNAAQHKQLIDNLNAEISSLEKLKAPVIAMLKDYAVLKGTSQSTSPAEKAGIADQFVLSLNPQTKTWTGQGQSVNRTSGTTESYPVVAAVAIVNEKPALQIASPKRAFLFTDIDTAGGKMTGVWRAPTNPNGKPSSLTIAQTMDAKGRDQLFATRKTALQQMSPGTVFHALINDQYSNGNQPPNPISLTLKAGASGAFTGTVVYPLEGCTIAVTGKEVDSPTGPQIAVQYGAGKANPGAWGDVAQFLASVQHETWLVSASGDASGPMRLSGYGTTAPTNSSMPLFSVELIPFTDQDAAAITAALTAGAKFKVTTPQVNAPDDILTFSIDPITKKVSGSLTGPGNHLNASPGMKCLGDMSDLDGWTELSLPILRLNSSSTKPVYSYTVVITPTDGGLYMSGFVYNIQMTPAGPHGRWDAIQVKP